jgi:hypothetical protein
MSLRARDRALGRFAVLACAVLATAALAGACPASSGAAVTIGTTEDPGFRGGYEFGGGESVASIGQVVTVPEGVTTLESFTLSPRVAPSFLFRAYVFAWNNSETTGPALYESGDLHAPSESSYQPLKVTTGGVLVTPGQQYVLFFSRSAEQAADEADNNGYAVELVRSEEIFQPPPYQEGGLVTLSNGYAPSEWGTREWSDFGFVFDTEFEATFDTPAPLTKMPEAPQPSPVTPLPATAPASAVTPHCVVPSLGDLKLAAVKKALKAAGCSLGAVDHHFFGRPKGELMEQSFHQGTMLPVGAKVDVWLSLGAHQRHHKSGR